MYINKSNNSNQHDNSKLTTMFQITARVTVATDYCSSSTDATSRTSSTRCALSAAI